MNNFGITAVFKWRGLANGKIFGGKHRAQFGLVLISAGSSADDGLALIYIRANSTLLTVLFANSPNELDLFGLHAGRGRGALHVDLTRYPIEWVVLEILSTCVFCLYYFYQIRWP